MVTKTKNSFKQGSKEFGNDLKNNLKQLLIGGSERIRTAVEAFAELYLASRSRNLCVLKCKGK
jgi:hypothetical protein